MSKKGQISDEDKALFREHVKGARPIHSDKIEPDKVDNRTKKTAPKQPRESYEDHKLQELVSTLYDSDDDIPIGPSDELPVYTKSGVDQKTLAKLKAGKIPIDGRLDLHGMTADEAKVALVRYISQKRCQKRQCLCIIHGKGYRSNRPVLKTKISRWLRQMKEVVAFASAPQKLGGTGAVLVLIKKE